MPRYTTRLLISLLAGASVVVAATATRAQAELSRLDGARPVVVRT